MKIIKLYKIKYISKSGKEINTDHYSTSRDESRRWLRLNFKVKKLVSINNIK